MDSSARDAVPCQLSDLLVRPMQFERAWLAAQQRQAA